MSVRHSGGGGAPHIKWLAMVVLLRPGCKFRILVSRCSGQNGIIFSREGLV